MNKILNTKYKDGVFRALFGKEDCRENLLSLYNALNGTTYTDTGDLVINTLEDVIYINIKNDVSCIIDQNMSLYEHQSTFCPNMPIRGLMYFSKLYSSVIEKQPRMIYGKSLIVLPTPQYYVFYNGNEERPDREVLRLSDAFACPVSEGEFEWTATVLNINDGHNRQLMEACRILKEYSLFMEAIRKYCKIYDDNSVSIELAIDECIANGILASFLKEKRAEVIEMCLTTFDEEKYRSTLLEEGREEGRAEGREEGRAEGREEGRAEGREEGRAEGRKEGRGEGAELLFTAIMRLKNGETPEALIKSNIPENIVTKALQVI